MGLFQFLFTYTKEWTETAYGSPESVEQKLKSGKGGRGNYLHDCYDVHHPAGRCWECSRAKRAVTGVDFSGVNIRCTCSHGGCWYNQM